MAQNMLDVLGYVVPQASSSRSGGLPRLESAVISEMPITIFRETPLILRGPSKTMMYFRRTQLPPGDSLEEDRPLRPHGMPGSWGYIFKYKKAELCFYQLEEGETQRPLAVSDMLTSRDWSVLTMVMQQHLQETSQESIADPVPSKRPRLENLPTCREVLQKTVAFGAVWQSKVVGSDRWNFRMTLRSMGEKKPAEFFVLESYNADCGVFHTVLVLPLSAWIEWMETAAEKITTLFSNCQSWRDTLFVKKTF